MKIDSLSEKLILYFVLLGIGSIMIFGAVAFYGTREALLNRTFDQLTSLRIVKMNQVGQFYSDRMLDIAFLAGLEEVSDPSPEGVRMLTTKYRALGKHFLGFYIVGNRGVQSMGCFTDSTANILPLITPDFISRARSKLESQPVVIFDVQVDPRTGNPCQMMATRVKRTFAGKNDDARILVLAISADAINSIMLNNDPKSGLGLSGETYLVGPDLLMRSSSRFLAGSILKTAVWTQPIFDALAGRTGAVTATDYRGIRVLSSFSKTAIPGLNWVIVAEIDEAEAMIPIYETRTRLLLLSVIIIVVFFGFVMVISRRIAKPLIRLKEATVDLGEGVYNIDLPVTTQDEIGALTASFNIMARQIKEKTTELEKERFGRMRSVFDGEEMERQRLSRELHDGIGQSLVAVRLRLENLLYQDGKEVRSSIQELRNYFDQIIDEVRRISNNLMPSVLEVFSIPIAFRNLFTETEEHSDLKIFFEAKGNFDDLNRKIKTYIYRLTQEAITNIVKHAEASEVRVSLARSADQLTLVIRDDGKGFAPELAGKAGGNGIHNMRERASLLQGHIEIRSLPSKGTTITLNVPIINTYDKNPDFSRG